tara:strand:+ start:2164 stop:2301 length:138 start_codon:yes stop_codon:yes gene_type:complete
MFWKRKKHIDPKDKKMILDEIKTLRNSAMYMVKECERITKLVDKL